jgi:integrase
MPKPYLLARPSGLYVRFRVPRDLAPRLGFGSIVRSLRGLRGDSARLSAALQAVALSGAFDRLRKGGEMVDVKKLLESAQRAAEAGVDRPWTASNVRVGGVDFGTVQTTGREDTLDFIEAMKAADEMVAKAWASTSNVSQTIPGSDSPLLSEEIANHIADLEQRQLAPDTITESRHSLRLLLGVVGDRPVSEIKRSEIRVFWDAVRWWPANASVKPRYRDLSVQDIVEKGRAEGVPAPSKHTINKHRQRLGVFFNSLVEGDVLTKSPLRGMGGELDTSTDLDTGRPFTDAELAQVFDPGHFLPWAETPHRFWGPILGLYTGARVNELAQLYLDDVRQVDGVWGLFFWKQGRSQKIKTKSSIRFVPLAQPVLDAGFLDFIDDMRATGHPRLFPHLPAGTKKDGTPNGLGYGRQLSRQFAAYVKRFGIEQGVAFHAFRHTLSTKLAEAKVPVGTIAMITGHAKKQEVPVLEAHYIHIADVKSLPERVAALEKFKPPVALTVYEKGRFSIALADREALHP